MNNKNILLVKSGYPSKEFVLKKLKKLDYNVIILDSEISCPNKYANNWIISDLSDFRSTTKIVRKFLKEKNIKLDGVITFWDEAVLLTSFIANSLKLPGKNSMASTDEIKNKYFFRQICEHLGLPAPKSTLIRTQANIDKISKEFQFPVVIKPIYGAASAFVVKVETKEELKQYFRIIKSNMKNFWLASEWKNLELYVEEYIDGKEVDIDILIQDGKIKFYSITDNFPTQEPFFIETGWQLPSTLPSNQKDELIEMAQKVLKTFHVKNGCIHFEAKYSSHGPVPIEINLRMGGDEVYSFIKKVWNVDLIENALKIATGENIEKIEKIPAKTFLTSYDFIPFQEGIVKKVKIDNSIYDDPNLHLLSVSSQVGDLIKLPPFGYDYHGWVSAKGKTPEESINNLMTIVKKISFKLSPVNKDQINQKFQLEQ